MKEITVELEFFSPKDTLECGQIFRFFPVNEGYLVLSNDKACIVMQKNDTAVICCEESDEEYFYNYFDLSTDYSAIYSRAQKSKYEILKKASSMGKGVRILRQNSEEMLISFLISQNNNIPRIKKIINTLSEKFGEKKRFLNYEYYAFPSAKILSEADDSLLKECGLGYRAPYLKGLCKEIASNDLINRLTGLNEELLKKELLAINGIGEKVANCIMLFGLGVMNSFPVDTWINKVYNKLTNTVSTDRKKITKELTLRYGNLSGYAQQYFFYYFRENKIS
jgi:N-glycosylase/DNA lyase